MQERRAQVLEDPRSACSRARRRSSGKLVELARREQGMADRETHLKQLQEELKQAKARGAHRARADLRA